LVVAVFVPALGLLLVVVAAVAAGGWLYYTKHHPKAPTSQAAASATPPLDLDGAVAVLRGNALPERKALALAALEQQAKSGNARAMVMTAACYRAGLGTRADDHFKAFEWYRKAAQAGEPVAMVEMSRYYAEGVWVEADKAQSKQWLQRAAKAGDAEAKWQLATEGK
jgi:hypothetical protein